MSVVGVAAPVRRREGVVAEGGPAIAWESFGEPSRRAVVLIQGWAMQGIGWPDGLCEGLARRGAFVVRFDNRDIGLSEHLDGLGPHNLRRAMLRSALGLKVRAAYGLSDMADDTLRVLDAHSIGAAHLVGTSMGGMIAQRIAIDHPERCASLTCLMSSSSARGLPDPKFAVACAMALPPSTRTARAWRTYCIDFLELLRSPGFEVPRDAAAQYVDRAFARGFDPDGTDRQMCAALSAPDRSAELSRLAVPSLIVHGAADPVIPVEHGRQLASVIPGAVYEEIEGLAHDLPPVFVERLEGMIAGLLGFGVPLERPSASSELQPEIPAVPTALRGGAPG